MKKFNKKQVAKQEPEKEVESGSEEEVDMEEQEDDEDDDDEEEEDNEIEGEDDDDDDEEDEEDDNEEDAEEEEEDDDDDEDEDDNPLAPKKIPFDTPKVEAKDDLVSKFMETYGKRLYVRFPNRLPETQEELTKQLKGYCKLIQNIIKPRQKYARHCMVEFANEEDREKSLKILSAVEIDGTKLIVKHPEMDDQSFVEKALQQKAKKKQEKKMKQKLRKLAKKQQAMATSSLFITNIPPTATVADLKENFPNAVDIKLKHTKDNQGSAKASVTLPTPEDATKAKKKKITIAGNELQIKFDINTNKKSWRAVQNKKWQASKKEGKAGTKRKANSQNNVVQKKKKIESGESSGAEKKIDAKDGKKNNKKVAGKGIEKKKGGKKPQPNKKPVGVSV